MEYWTVTWNIQCSTSYWLFEGSDYSNSDTAMLTSTQMMQKEKKRKRIRLEPEAKSFDLFVLFPDRYLLVLMWIYEQPW